MKAKKKNKVSKKSKYEKDMEALEKKYAAEIKLFNVLDTDEKLKHLHHGQLMLLDMIEIHERDISITREWLKMVGPELVEKAVAKAGGCPTCDYKGKK